MTSSPVQPGDVLAGKYRVERVLGAGGMGVVVQAMHVQLDERVALKFLRTEALDDAELVGRFAREARLAVKLKSEHVAKVMDVGSLENGSPYIVMEYLEGEDLHHVAKRTGSMQLVDVAEYIIQACDGMAEAHVMGIVHRDLKPANLFLTRRLDGSPLVKVLDFGISKATALNDGSLGMTKTSSTLGSPYYMSPEQMKSSRDVDARSDVWSMGVILYKLLTARLPFESDTLGGLMAKVLEEEPPSLAVHRPDVPPAVAGIVARCLQRDLRQRAASVAEIALALAPYAPPRAHPIAERIASVLGAVGAAPSSASVPRGVTPSVPVLATSQALGASQAAKRKGGTTLALLAGAVLAVVFGLGFGVWRLLSPPRGAPEGAGATSLAEVDSAKLPPAAPSTTLAGSAAASAPPVVSASSVSSANTSVAPTTVVRPEVKTSVRPGGGSQKPAASAGSVVPRLGRD